MKNLNKLKHANPSAMPTLRSLKESPKKLEHPVAAIWDGKLERVRNKTKK